jgi:membrane associated rhomboid family serine protease
MSEDDGNKGSQPEPHQDHFSAGRRHVPSSHKAEPSPNKREPIFNKTPLGVAVLIAIILAAHLSLLLAGHQATLIAHLNLGVSPQRLYSSIEQREFVAVLLPLIAHQFLHGGTLHIMMNLAMLLQAGPVAELGFGGRRDGLVRFIAFFIASGIGGALMYCVVNSSSTAPTIGASGAISGVFAGFLWAAIGLAKPGQAMLRPVLVSAAFFLLINVGLAWVGRVMNVVPIAWESHLGGFLAGLILYPLFARAGRSRLA